MDTHDMDDKTEIRRSLTKFNAEYDIDVSIMVKSRDDEVAREKADVVASAVKDALENA